MAARAIRTPDQRLRIFVSSTLRELEPERDAVRDVLERMQLAPVMFELGARPHPPRELYRSYLAQSDVFLGIYWERYGWVAPGEEISGLEDEYRLSSGLPSLIYLKDPAPGREPRLDALLGRIRDDDRTSYRSFRTPEELAALVQGDIATLLAERFDAAAAVAAGASNEVAADRSTPATDRPGIPVPYATLVGRDTEAGAVQTLLQTGARLVTIVGPGGVGKSRLAIEVADAAATEGRDVAFALLESVPTAHEVPAAIARALGVRNSGEAGLEDRIALAMGTRPLLVVVDNIEHVLDASDLLVRLLDVSPGLQLLVTSRSPLRLRAERVVDLGPLAVPESGVSTAEIASSPAVELFAQRAGAVSPRFALTDANAEAVAAVCRAVDGMPLAIELAAARARALSPEEILDRLGSSLSLLAGGARDLPERQRALRSTIEWSVDLLDEPSRRALRVLATFAGAFRVASAEAVLSEVGEDDPLGVIEALVDASLVRPVELGAESGFALLSLVRTFAKESLADLPDGTDAWIARYRTVAASISRRLMQHAQLETLAEIDFEFQDLAAVEHMLLARGDLAEAAEHAWEMYLFLWIGGYLGVVRNWMTDLVSRAEASGTLLEDRTRAIALYYDGSIRFWQDPSADVVPVLEESRDLFHRGGDQGGEALAGVSHALALLTRRTPDALAAASAELDTSYRLFDAAHDGWGRAMVLVLIGRIELLGGDTTSSRSHFEQSLALATVAQERLGIVIARGHLGWARLLAGDGGGVDDLRAALDLSLQLGHDEGIAYGLESMAGVRASEGRAEDAGLLMGAAEVIREKKGLVNDGAFEFWTIPVTALREHGDGDVLDAAQRRGRQLTLAEALTHARA